MIDSPLDDLRVTQIREYKKKYPHLTEEEITDVLDSSLLDYALRVRAAIKLLACAVDELKGGSLDHEL